MNAELFTYRVVDGREGFTSSLSAICQLRYQVYVNEWGFERPEDHPGGLERDEYDQHSIHFYACPKHSDDVIGAARIILGSERPLPIERHFDISQLPSGVRREQSAEISRLAVSKEFRCRTIERAIFKMKQTAANHIHHSMDSGLEFRRHFEQELVRGLYISLYRDSKLRGLTHWFAVMAKGLHVILKRWGISFEQIGPARDYHGIRAPYLVSLESIERSLEKNYPVLYCELQKHLMYGCA
jgi:N-acyl amino acid synthase of PEP-CTERM/exosortase system